MHMHLHPIGHPHASSGIYLPQTYAYVGLRTSGRNVYAVSVAAAI